MEYFGYTYILPQFSYLFNTFWEQKVPNFTIYFCKQLTIYGKTDATRVQKHGAPVKEGRFECDWPIAMKKVRENYKVYLQNKNVYDIMYSVEDCEFSQNNGGDHYDHQQVCHPMDRRDGCYDPA